MHGVASGDPLTDRVIIWTRVSTEEESPVEVEWKVATDPALTLIVQNGLYTTGAHRDYTVKVDVGGLEAGKTYYYGFTALGKASIVGKTKTAPSGMVDQAKFAVVSCSNLQHGYFNGYGRIADRTDLDAVIHLGDYIYEYSATGDDFYGAEVLRDNGERLHFPDREIVTLDDYRARYAQYRMDPDLLRAHQQHPFILIWDDHESANDAYEDGAENHQEGEGVWTDRKAIAKQVYDEWMPVRSDLNEFPLYRTIEYGELVDLVMLDTRLEGREEQINNVLDPALYAADRTILGEEQKAWFFDQLSSSDAAWKVIGNQVIFSEFNVWWAANPADPVLNNPIVLESIFLDIWDGYPSEREQIMDFISGASTNSPIDNVVILTGDFHSTFGYDVTRRPSPLSGSDPSIPAAGTAPVPVTPTYDPSSGAGSIAVEFATPSITSANFDENLPPPVADAFEFQINRPLGDNAGPLAGINPNPHMKYADLNRHGYFILDITPEHAQADWFFTEDIFTRNNDEVFGQAWFTRNGQNYLQQSEGPSAAKPQQDTPAPDAPKPATPELKGQRDDATGDIFLEWGDGIAETGYVVERSLNGGDFEEVAALGEDEVEFVDQGIALNVAASYRVKATNEAFASDFSNTVTITAPSASAFTLIDASSDTEIRPIQDGDVIDLRELDGIELSVVAEFREVNPVAVQFYLNGAEIRTEGVAPYALGGDEAGDFAPVPELRMPGAYYLKAVPLSSSSDVLEAGTVFFQVIDSDLYVSDFVLVDAATNNDLAVLPKGKAVIDPVAYGTSEFSIRAEVSTSETGSVQFYLNDKAVRTENVSPYALGGDVGGDYAPYALLTSSGTSQLTARPFLGSDATGDEGTALTLEITVEGGVEAAGMSGGQNDRQLLLSEVPDKVALAGNYPNPFNPTTAVRFGLPEQMDVRIVLYDLLGRVVDVVVDGQLSTGWHTVQIDGSNLASGVYIYQLETDNQVLIGQMILQK